jgi:hypothetical protein
MWESDESRQKRLNSELLRTSINCAAFIPRVFIVSLRIYEVRQFKMYSNKSSLGIYSRSEFRWDCTHLLRGLCRKLSERITKKENTFVIIYEASIKIL